MDKKPYALGLIVGRFQMLHAGHEAMIQKGLELCERLCILVGSSQEYGTVQNPFSYELREHMLRSVFGQKILIYPLPDLGAGNNSTWGAYVLKNVVDRVGVYPELLISAVESRRMHWFDGIDGCKISELYLPKSNPISATQMRKYFYNNDEEAWKAQANPKLWPMYETMRRQVLDSQNNLHTDSI